MGFLVDVAKSLFTEWLVYWLPLVVALVVGYLRSQNVSVVDTLVAGLMAGAAVYMTMTAWRLQRYVERQAPVVTSENVRQRVRDWLDAFGFSVRTYPDVDGVLFNFGVEVPPPDGGLLHVYRSESRRNYVFVATGFDFRGEAEAILKQMSIDEHVALVRELTIELTRLGLEHDDVRAPLSDLLIKKPLPITGDFSEFSFINAVSAVNAARRVTMAIADQHLFRKKKPAGA